jgi:hypothetical protein
MYKESLFVFIKGKQRESNGIYAIRSKDVINAGIELV